MKKFCAVVGLAFLLIQGGSVSSQSFQFVIHDSIVYCAPKALGDTSCEGNSIINKTSNALTIDVVRVQDVNFATSGWESAFCIDVCYPPTTDSVRYTIAPSDTVDFIPHFYYTATPDSQTIYMKIKNVSNPADVAYQRFYGVTQIGFGIHEYANLAQIKIYPSPVISGSDFNFTISNLKVHKKEFSLVVYNMYGSEVKTLTNLCAGDNMLTLDLTSGLYSYNLVSGNIRINSGNFSIIK